MKRALLLIFIILQITGLNAQNQTDAKDVSNKLTKKHIRIPGTHLYLVPFKGLTISDMFTGLADNKSVNIVVLDVFGGNFKVQSKDFNKETFEATGLTVFDYKEFNINNKQAKYLYTNSLNSPDKNLMLAFGDSTFTVLITGTIYANAEKVLKQVEKCILSAIYDDKITINPFETAKFELDLSKSEYRFKKISSGSYIYSLTNAEGDSIDAPFFVVSKMPYKEATDEILKLTTKQMMGEAEELGANFKLDFKKFEINGYPAIETTGYGEKNGEKILYYLLVLGKQNNVTVINSVIKNDYEINLKKLADIAYTIKLK